MIIIRLTGGLGNQLFQYAYGMSLSESQNEKLVLDTSWYKGRINRRYMLDLFNTEVKKASWLTRILHKKNILQDFSGRWHSETYFKNIERVLRRNVTLKNPLSESSAKLLTHIQTTHSVSLHLRGGDYVRGNKSGFHGTCSPEYYTAAVEKMRTEYPDAHFFIFTDDLPWAQEHIQFPTPHTVVSKKENPPEEELILMSSCKHNIIANSTFSWWGAWLNQNTEKLVIAPSKWFADGGTHEKTNTSDILPASWFQI